MSLSVSSKVSQGRLQDLETVSTSSNALQDATSVNDFLNAAATETVPLLEFLLEYDVFVPSNQ